jgi:hypothetical protein
LEDHGRSSANTIERTAKGERETHRLHLVNRTEEESGTEKGRSNKTAGETPAGDHEVTRLQHETFTRFHDLDAERDSLSFFLPLYRRAEQLVSP